MKAVPETLSERENPPKKSWPTKVKVENLNFYEGDMIGESRLTALYITDIMA